MFHRIHRSSLSNFWSNLQDTMLHLHGTNSFTTAVPNNTSHRNFGRFSRIYNSTGQLPVSRSLNKSYAQVNAMEQEVAIALGSNVGDRLHNFQEALRMMKDSGIYVKRHACLYESAPAYVTDQPHFLNSAVRCLTELGPHDLLKALKEIERKLGRTDGIRYGPRPIDLDILFYGKCKIDTEDLKVPHERIYERPFVMAPLIDLLGSSTDNDVTQTWKSLTPSSDGLFKHWEHLGGETLIGRNELRRVFPLGPILWDPSDHTVVMGILNVTPDSFSDGGRIQSVDDAISQVRLMISEGVDIIDIGAQSTRPMAPRITVEEELHRLIPILDALVKLPEINGKLLSVDTFYSEVAFAAVSSGVHIINDISGGQLDPNMLKVVSDLNVPYILMHMRGDPLTMQNNDNIRYNDVCKDVAHELSERILQAELSGIPAWRIMVDPGIGFSKKREHNLEILTGLPYMRKVLSERSVAASHMPILIGPSRKKFLGDICNRGDPVDRDPATIAAITAGLLNGANAVRVHNVRNCSDAAKVSDALRKHRKSHT